jgi:hypothetical protein
MDQLDDALIDVQTSTGALDDVLAHLGDEDPEARERCLSALTRLILIDVTAMRAAFEALHRTKGGRPPRPPKGGGGGLAIVDGGAA